jgi:Protein of unknown function (DUF2490)
MKKIVLWSGLFLLQNTFAQAQNSRNYIHNQIFWSMNFVNGKISKDGKLNYEIEYQYRRISDPDNLTQNRNSSPFAHLQQHFLRPWLYYQLNPNVRFSLSPVSWFGTWGYANGNLSSFVPEYRITPQVTLMQTVGRFSFQHRFRYEWRFIGQNSTDVSQINKFTGGVGYDDFSNTRERFRYLIRMNALLNKAKMEPGAWYSANWNELFVSMGERVPNLNIFDQNRVFIGVGHKLDKHIRIEAGFLNQTIFKFNNATRDNVDSNSGALLSLFVDDFGGLLHGK